MSSRAAMTWLTSLGLRPTRYCVRAAHQHVQGWGAAGATDGILELNTAPESSAPTRAGKTAPAHLPTRRGQVHYYVISRARHEHPSSVSYK